MKLHLRYTSLFLVVAVLCSYIVIDIDLIPRLLLPPAKFADWYEHHPEWIHAVRDKSVGHPLNYAMNPQRECPHNSSLVVYIHSAVTNFARRSLIRATWGNKDVLQSFHAFLIFVVGRSTDGKVMELVARESRRHDDILMADIIDSYYNLTYKAITALNWVATECPFGRFVVKTDDDVMVSMTGLNEELSRLTVHDTPPRNVLACSVIKNPQVNRHWWSKWYISKWLYVPHSYGNFCEGAAFIMSYDVVKSLKEHSWYMPFFPLDDVFVTGMLAEVSKIRHINIGHRIETGNWNLYKGGNNNNIFTVEEDLIKFVHLWYSIP